VPDGYYYCDGCRKARLEKLPRSGKQPGKPSGGLPRDPERNAWICRMYAEGVTQYQLARWFALSQTTIRQILGVRKRSEP
jgi:hypothetical protein